MPKSHDLNNCFWIFDLLTFVDGIQYASGWNNPQLSGPTADPILTKLVLKLGLLQLDVHCSGHPISCANNAHE